MASSSSPSDKVEQRIAGAQNVPLDLEKCTPLIAKYVCDHSSSIGCPKQLFLIPLQPIAAHFMGSKAYVKEGWSEPIILWKLLLTKAKKIACSWMLA